MLLPAILDSTLAAKSAQGPGRDVVTDDKSLKINDLKNIFGDLVVQLETLTDVQADPEPVAAGGKELPLDAGSGKDIPPAVLPGQLLRAAENPFELPRPAENPAELLRPAEDPVALLRTAENPLELPRTAENPLELPRPAEDPVALLRTAENPLELPRSTENPAEPLQVIADLHGVLRDKINAPVTALADSELRGLERREWFAIRDTSPLKTVVEPGQPRDLLNNSVTQPARDLELPVLPDRTLLAESTRDRSAGIDVNRLNQAFTLHDTHAGTVRPMQFAPAADGSLALNAAPNVQAGQQNPLTPSGQVMNIQQQLFSPDWSESFNSNLLLMVKERIQVARLNLNPPELGPVEVRLSIQNDHTNIQFITQHGVVRDVIEDAFPRLREMMSASGLNLGDVNVSHHSSPEQAADTGQDPASAESGAEEDDSATVTEVRITSTGLVDHYI
ncbi:MAG: flagellar hook-length control protein FliK [Thiotrichales bacterium]|nr:flagellar hook-length control protein FliK [Thiotrichales bacterium]